MENINNPIFNDWGNLQALKNAQAPPYDISISNYSHLPGRTITQKTNWNVWDVVLLVGIGSVVIYCIIQVKRRNEESESNTRKSGGFDQPNPVVIDQEKN